jgi:hypothetical protein
VASSATPRRPEKEAAQTLHELPRDEDFAKQAAAIRFGCGNRDFELSVMEKVVAVAGNARFGIGLGLMSHRSHDHFLLIQLEPSASGVWQLQSAAHTETQPAADVVLALDMRSCGTFSVGVRLTSPAHSLRLVLGTARSEASMVGGSALLVATALPDGNSTPTIEVLDAYGHVVRALPMHGTGSSDIGVSFLP